MAVGDFIPINRAKQTGNLTVRAAELISELSDLLNKLSNIAGHGINGADYTVLETQFGIATGAGANFASLLGLMQNIFNTNTEITGANRLSQIKEFIGRIAGQ
jgi:hypothetical protein